MSNNFIIELVEPYNSRYLRVGITKWLLNFNFEHIELIIKHIEFSMWKHR